MAKFKVKAKAEDAQKAGDDGGDFILPPPGYYQLRIVEANAGFSKTDGEEDKNKPRIEIVYEIDALGMDGGKPAEENYGRLWDYVTFGDGYAATRRVEFAVAMGADKEEIANGAEPEFDTEELLERKVVARIKHEKDKIKSVEEKKTVMRARVATVLPLSAADGASATNSGEVDFGGDDEEEEETEKDPFTEEEATEEEDDEENEFLTEEELESYEPKDLSAVVKEFGLDPSELMIKFKSGEKKGKVNIPASKKAMIEAILEAQDAPEEEADSEEEDDGNPF